MLKHSAQLEVRKEDRIYQLNLPVNCPLGEVYDVLYQMRSYIVDRLKEAQKSDQPKESEQEKSE